MADSLGTFHHKHGSNIRLLEEGTVAHRVDNANNGIVFTDQPIPIGNLFQVKLIAKHELGFPIVSYKIWRLF